jgi:hypothetical protein
MILGDRVVVDRDVARPAGQQEKIAAAAPVLAVDVGEHVVAHRDRLRLLARMVVVVAEDVDARRAVTHHVPLEVDVIDGAPRTAAILVTDGEHHREPRLPALPVVFQGVTNDRNASRVLQLDQVLDDPVLAPPFSLLGELISADRDVGRHQARDERIRAAEQQVLAGRFEVVVRDGKGSRTIPAAHSLRVLVERLDVRDVRTADRRRCAVERDAPLLARAGIAMQEQPIDDDVVRNLRRGVLRAGAVAERDEIAGSASLNLEQSQPPVVRPRIGQERRSAAHLAHLRQVRRVGRGHACSVAGQAAVAGRANGDERTPALHRQPEAPRERRPGGQRDRVPRRRAVDRLLKVASGRDRDRRRGSGQDRKQKRSTHQRRNRERFHRG